jgi:uncharacterized protein (DUF2237 family)
MRSKCVSVPRDRELRGAPAACELGGGLDAGVASPVVLRGTHENALEHVPFEELKKRTLDLA